MDTVATLMEYYPYVFHPAVLIGGGTLLLIYVEWDRQDASRGALRARVGALLVAGLFSLVPTVAYMVVTGQGPMETTRGNVWQVDALVASGLLVVAGSLWFVWRRFEWGTIVPGAMQALAAVAVPYVALSPFWNVSGHVILALMPTLYLTLVDRRFWPLLAIPALMIPNRLYLDAHSADQVVGGLIIAGALVVVVSRRRASALAR